MSTDGDGCVACTARYGDQGLDVASRQYTRGPAAGLPGGLAWEVLPPIRSPTRRAVTCFAR
jgi:hypothetical protein